MGKSVSPELLCRRDRFNLQFSSSGILKSCICGVSVKVVERKSPLATCTFERPFQSKHSSSAAFPSPPSSPYPLPYALNIRIIHFFVPHLLKLFHLTFMHLAGEDLTGKGYMLSHSTIRIVCFLAARCYQLPILFSYQLAIKHSVLGGKT